MDLIELFTSNPWFCPPQGVLRLRKVKLADGDSVITGPLPEWTMTHKDTTSEMHIPVAVNSHLFKDTVPPSDEIIILNRTDGGVQSPVLKELLIFLEKNLQSIDVKNIRIKWIDQFSSSHVVESLDKAAELKKVLDVFSSKLK